MKKSKLFGSDIEPACEYCLNGSSAEDGLTVACRYRGIKSINDKCRRFKYDPLKRVPKRQPDLPTYNEDDFKL